MEYVIHGSDDDNNHAWLKVYDTRYPEEDVSVVITYGTGEELFIAISRGDLEAMAHGIIGAPLRAIEEGTE